MAEITIRDARRDDHAAIVAFNLALALETEDKHLDPATIERGVALALDDPDRLRYWIAEAQTPGGTVVIGQAAITREWSDWRAGWIWWFQSVYVHREFRGRGVFRQLHAAIRTAARAESDTVGLRLYVENHNDRARRVYETLGLGPSGYDVYEEIWPTPA